MKTQGREKAVVREGALTVDYGHALFKCTRRFIGDFTGGSVVGSPLASAGEGNGSPVQYSCLENSMDGGA